MKALRRIGWLCILSLFACNAITAKEKNVEQQSEKTPVYTNALATETSPYLLQHAHNPVNWFPWGEEALKKAAQEDKLLIISIGYSACHWCHVMEHESFEDTAVANIMNEHFISIKVDREERPDIDQIYMDAVHLLNQRGGWPLNCIALPDGKPFYGGTYFRKEQWMSLLNKIHYEYTNNREKVEEFALQLTEGVRKNEQIVFQQDTTGFTLEDLDPVVEKWTDRFDHQYGGAKGAPKFPIPNNYEFLLAYAHTKNDQGLLDYIGLTLDRIAFGGIYDHIGGGFARYATDAQWKVPHFEKMLYDNAQMVSLYAKAFQKTGKVLYKEVVYETLAFVERELTDESGAFYSALDADSEGEEGKFYVWKKPALKEALGDLYDTYAQYYNVNDRGLWEHGNYIPLRHETKREVASKLDITEEELEKRIVRAKKILMDARDKRVRPGLDDKCLTSWNALMIKGYVDAYSAFGEPRFIDAAKKNAQHLLKHVLKSDGSLYHSYKNGRTTINGYLEDYCFLIEALIGLYQSTFETHWIDQAKALASFTIEHFYDAESALFYFTSDQDPALIARKKELNDNVIPASNSSMAKGLFLLGQYFNNAEWVNIAERMLQQIAPHMERYGPGYSNWGLLMLQQSTAFYEVAIVGKEALEKAGELRKSYLPNSIFLGSESEAKSLPLLANKYIKGNTVIYVCVDKTCQLPVKTAAEALQQMR